MPRVQAPSGGIQVGGKFYPGGRFLPGPAGGGYAIFHGDQAKAAINEIMEQRAQKAGMFFLTRVRRNISRPVIHRPGETIRSKPGEYPRKETGQLSDTLQSIVTRHGSVITAYVGSPLDYAVWLENNLDRSFLERTFRENQTALLRLMTKPITDKRK